MRTIIHAVVAPLALGVMIIGFLDRRDGLVIAGAILEGALIVSVAITSLPVATPRGRGFDVVVEARE